MINCPFFQIRTGGVILFVGTVLLTWLCIFYFVALVDVAVGFVVAVGVDLRLSD